jgi:hypothetical protein
MAPVNDPVIVRKIIQLRDGSLNRILGRPVGHSGISIFFGPSNLGNRDVPIILNTGLGGFGAAWGLLAPEGAAELVESAIGLCNGKLSICINNVHPGHARSGKIVAAGLRYPVPRDLILTSPEASRSTPVR